MNGTERNHPLVERLAVRRRTTPGVLEHGRLYQWYARFQRRSIKSGLLERLLQRLSLSADAAGGTLVWRNAWQADGVAAESFPNAYFSRSDSEALNRRAAESGSQSAAQSPTQGTAQSASVARLARPVGVASAADFGSRRAESRTGRADVAGFALRMQARHGGTPALPGAVGKPLDAPLASRATQATTQAGAQAGTQVRSSPALTAMTLSRTEAPVSLESASLELASPKPAPLRPASLDPVSLDPASLELISRQLSHESVVNESVVHEAVHELAHEVTDEVADEVTHEYVLRESHSRDSASSRASVPLERVSQPVPPPVSRAVESRSLTPASAGTPLIQRVSQRAAAAQSATEALREVSFTAPAPAPEPRSPAVPAVRSAMPTTFERAVGSAAQPTLLLRKAMPAAAETPRVVESLGDGVAHQRAESAPSRGSPAAETYHQAARLRSEPVMETRQFDKLMEKLVARFEIEARRRGLYRWR